MAYDLSETTLTQAQNWAKSAEQTGWLNPSMTETLSDANLREPESLFKSAVTRPLLVAFLGGTGVGKSSLLNRLAGKAIAKAGIERPTSKEVTLYHHQSLSLQDLPANLPLEKIRIAAHDDLANKQLVWLDMPDFDSTEKTNQDIVLQWLPYLDVLIYVVSPERYRDNKAWRLLLAEGSRHAWLFVLNQWDKGCTEQYEDFKGQLHQAGFDNPLVFKTDCSLTLPDEFTQLQNTIIELATDQTVQQLSQRGNSVRLNALSQNLQVIAGQLGTTQGIETLSKQWPEQWQKTIGALQKSFALAIQLQANQYADHQSSAIKSLGSVEQRLWDDWSQNRFNDVLDELIHQADDLKIPVMPVKNGLQNVRDKAAEIFNNNINIAVKEALLNPGSTLQNLFLKFSQFCEIILPIAAFGFVGYTVFRGYYESNITHQNYLGVDFATHSAMLIVLSWLIPFFIRKQLKPSLQKAAVKGMNLGVTKGLSEIEYEVQQSLEQLKQQRLKLIQQADQILLACQSNNDDSLKPQVESTLGRMLTNAN